MNQLKTCPYHLTHGNRVGKVLFFQDLPRLWKVNKVYQVESTSSSPCWHTKYKTQWEEPFKPITSVLFASYQLLSQPLLIAMKFVSDSSWISLINQTAIRFKTEFSRAFTCPSLPLPKPFPFIFTFHSKFPPLEYSLL